LQGLKKLFIFFDPHNTTTILLLQCLSKSIARHEKEQMNEKKGDNLKYIFFSKHKTKKLHYFIDNASIILLHCSPK
jgi:hypothetical protein